MSAAEEAGNKRIWTIERNKDLDADENDNSDPQHSHHHHKDGVDERVIYYLHKNYYKTTLLMTNSFKSAAVLGSYDSCTVRAAYNYGKHGGIAFRLVEDVLNFDVDGEYDGGNNNNGSGGAKQKMGNSTLMDIRLEVVTKPVLYAA